MKLPSLQNFYDGALCALLRFPFALISSLVGVAVSIYMAEHKSNFNEHLVYVVMVCSLGLPLFISIVLFCERGLVKPGIMLLIQIAGAILLIAYYFSLPLRFELKPAFRFCLFGIGLHLLVAFAAFIQGGNTNGFWQFNKSLFLRFLASALYSAVLYAGLSVAMLAIDQLFNLKVNGIRYFELWVFLAGVFNTWYFLAGIPKNFEELDISGDYPKGLKLFTQFVLLPLVTLYLLILYAYMAKIILAGSWPVGWVSYLVIGFSTLGVLSLLLIFPIQEQEENKWIKKFSRAFFFALFPMVVMLLLAIWRRVSEYGITEKRYFIVVLAIWLFCIAFYYSVRKFKKILVIPVSLCLLAFLTSFGSWGAFSISMNSQVHIFETYLEKNKMLENGKARKAPAAMSFREQQRLSSVVDYLVQAHGVKCLQPYFDQNLDSLTADSASRYNKHPDRILQLLGVKHYSRWDSEKEDSGQFNFSSNNRSVMDVRGFDFSFAYSAYYYKDQDTTSGDYRKNSSDFVYGADTLRLKFHPSGRIDLSINTDLPVYLNIVALAKALEGQASNDQYELPSEKMSAEGENDFYRVRLNFSRINGRMEEGKFIFNDVQGQVLVKKKGGESNSMSY